MAWDSMNQGGDILGHVNAEIATNAAQSFIRGRLHNRGGRSGPPHLAYIPDPSLSGHYIYNVNQQPLYSYDPTTHEHVHYKADGVTVGAYHAAGKHYTTDEHVHSATAINSAGGLTPPYWKTKQGSAIYGFATYPHTEIQFRAATGPLASSDHQVVTFGLDSHRMYFADPTDSTYYQFTQNQMLWPAQHQFLTFPAVAALTNPAAAPTAVASGTGSLFPAGTYSFAYAWQTALGWTVRSPSVNVTITAGQGILVTVPAFPATVIGARIYIQDTDGFWLTATQGSTTTYTILAYGLSGTRASLVNTTDIAAGMGASANGGFTLWEMDGIRARIWTVDGPFIFDHSSIITPAGLVIDGSDHAESGRILVTTDDTTNVTSRGDYGTIPVVFARPFTNTPDVVATSEDLGWIADVESISTTGFTARLSRRSSLLSVEMGTSPTIAISAANNSGANTIPFGVTFEVAPTQVICQPSSQDVIPVVSNITVNSFDVTLHYRPGVVTGTLSTDGGQTVTSAGSGTLLTASQNTNNSGNGSVGHTHTENTAVAYTQNATTGSGGISHSHDITHFHGIVSHTHGVTIASHTHTFTGTLQNVSATYTVMWITKGIRAAGSVTKYLRWIAHSPLG